MAPRPDDNPPVPEYHTVLANSRDPSSLARAHREQIDPAHARRVLESLLGDRGIPYEVHIGRARRRSWGGVRQRGGRRVGYVSLPGLGGGLTIGSVVHEAAHVVGMWTGASTDHGDGFVELLDELVNEAKSVPNDGSAKQPGQPGPRR